MSMDNSQSLFRVMGIDPGSQHTGVSLVCWDYCSEPIITEASTISLNNYDYPDIALYGTERHARIRSLGDQISALLTDYQPHAIAIESGYMGKFVEAFAVLVETAYCITQKAYEYNPLLPIIPIDPASVKKAIGVSGKSGDKELVRKAVENSKANCKVDLDSLNEHAIDAIAVGLYVINSLWIRKDL